MDRAVETELTRAARGSVDNADKILDVDEFDEADFVAGGKPKAGTKATTTKAQKQKARKAERKRKSKAKKRK